MQSILLENLYGSSLRNDDGRLEDDDDGVVGGLGTALKSVSSLEVSKLIPGHGQAQALFQGFTKLTRGLGSVESKVDALNALLSALDSFLDVIKADGGDKGLQFVRTALERCRNFAQDLPAHSKNSHDAYGFVQQVAGAVDQLDERQAVLVPVGWSLGDEKQPSHVLLLTVARVEGDQFEVFVCNGGEGIEFHPRTVQEESGGTLVNVPLRLRGAPRGRVTDPHW